MSDYKLEYRCLIDILFSYDEDERWKRILKANCFMYHTAIRELTTRFQDMVDMLEDMNYEEDLELYSFTLKAARRIYD